MYWLNVDQLKGSVDCPSPNLASNSQPQPRWGQTCVSANNRIYIIGGYEGKSLLVTRIQIALTLFP